MSRTERAAGRESFVFVDTAQPPSLVDGLDVTLPQLVRPHNRVPDWYDPPVRVMAQNESMIRPVLLLACALVLMLGACGYGEPSQPAPDQSAHAELCAAVDATDAGDVEAAEKAVFGRVHDQLHDLAARVEEEDRTVAARLLEAKAAVEADLARERGDRDRDVLARNLAELAAATAAAIDAVGGDPPEPCG